MIGTVSDPAAGLDLFSAALLERFREYHVPVLAENDGALQVWFPEPGIGGRPKGGSSLERHFEQEAVWQHVRRWPTKICAEGALA